MKWFSWLEDFDAAALRTADIPSKIPIEFTKDENILKFGQENSNHILIEKKILKNDENKKISYKNKIP